MRLSANNPDKIYVFEHMPVPKALSVMVIPTVISQLITLIYNMVDTWYIGQTNNPYMVAASSLIMTIPMLVGTISSLFGVGGGTLAVRLLGSKNESEAEKVASFSLIMTAIVALIFSLLCFIFMDPLLRLLGASDNTIVYARQYLFFVVIIGTFPSVTGNVMGSMMRNVGYAKEVSFGHGMGSVINLILDPIFMFVLLPDGYEVMGAALATLLSHFITFGYYTYVYYRLQNTTILSFPKRFVWLDKKLLKGLLAVGIPAATSILLFDITNIVINRLASSHGDYELAAMGLVLKILRLPQNIGVGICVGMVPLVAYNYASNNTKRMRSFISTSRLYGLIVAIIGIFFYLWAAPMLIKLFINDPTTVEYGIQYIRVRCIGIPFTFLCFHMVHLMQSLGQGKVSMALPIIRQLGLNIPLLVIMNHFFGMYGIVNTQLVADFTMAGISYVIYFKVMKSVTKQAVSAEAAS